MFPVWRDVGHTLSGFVLFVVSQEKTQSHNTEKPCQGLVQFTDVGICVTVFAHLSNLQYCSVLLFTAIEGMHNGLGRAFDIHHGETVGFP